MLLFFFSLRIVRQLQYSNLLPSSMKIAEECIGGLYFEVQRVSNSSLHFKVFFYGGTQWNFFNGLLKR